MQRSVSLPPGRGWPEVVAPWHREHPATAALLVPRRSFEALFFRITAQLIRVSDESHLCAQSYERGLHDVLEVLAEVARAVAREIQIKLTPHEKQRLEPDKTRSVNPQAHELYLRGRHFWYRRTEEGIRKSIECIEEALRHDPSLAAASDGMSDAHTMLACRGMTPAVESCHKAKAAARQAVRMEPAR
jgi:hypothetical protein